MYVPPFEEDASKGSVEERWRRPLHLMTALRAKGKQFDTVVLLDVRDGIWPNKNAQTAAQLEAERRVFYVAFTRARKKVVMLLDDRVGKSDQLRLDFGDDWMVSPYVGELGLTV